MRQVYSLLLFAMLILSGCGLGGQLNTGPELGDFTISASSNNATIDGINRIFITALAPNNTFTVNWETQGDANRDHTFDFFIRNQTTVDDEDNGFMFRQRCGLDASILSNCISVGNVKCNFKGLSELICNGVQTAKVNIELRDLSTAFMIGRICYLDESLNESCTSKAIAAEFHP